MSAINFKNGSWLELLSQLQTEKNDAVLNGKEYVFIYVCANWSAVCRKMEMETLADRNVCDFFNANFMNLRIYLGNIPDTAAITLKLSELIDTQIETLPHLIFLNNKGKVVHQAAGDFSAHDLLLEAKAALSFKYNWV